jgi:hypothetical protein
VHLSIDEIFVAFFWRVAVTLRGTFDRWLSPAGVNRAIPPHLPGRNEKEWPTLIDNAVLLAVVGPPLGG